MRQPNSPFRHRQAMRKFRLRSLAIFIPLFAAACCAVWNYRQRSRQTTAREVFAHAVESATLLPVAQAEAALPAREVDLLLKQAADSELIAFDGVSRVAQIQPNMLTYGERTLDGLSLHTIGDGKDSMTHQLPIGAQIHSIAFSGDTLLVTLSGTMEIRGKSITISEHRPETYRFQWKQGSPPPLESLTTSIWARPRKN